MSETRDQRPETRDQSKGENPLVFIKKISQCFFDEYVLFGGRGYDICIKNTHIAVYRERTSDLAKLVYKKNLTLEEEIEILQTLHKNKYDEYLNLTTPKTFNEKISWLSLYNTDPLMTKCTDKFAVREYIEDKIGEEYLIPLLGVWDKVDDIDFDELPEKFVLKVNWGVNQNIIVKDKSSLDIEEAKRQLKTWLYPLNNYYYTCLEWSYKDIAPKIIAEQFISESGTESPPDYKVLCFNGEPKVMMMVSGFQSSEYGFSFYSLPEWDKLPFNLDYFPHARHFEKPKLLSELLELSKILSKDFPHVSVDMYIVNDKIYFGELTILTGGGLWSISSEFNIMLGDMLTLPEPKR